MLLPLPLSHRPGMDFPAELLSIIIDYLDVRSILKLGLCSQRLRSYTVKTTRHLKQVFKHWFRFIECMRYGLQQTTKPYCNRTFTVTVGVTSRGTTTGWTVVWTYINFINGDITPIAYCCSESVAVISFEFNQIRELYREIYIKHCLSMFERFEARYRISVFAYLTLRQTDELVHVMKIAAKVFKHWRTTKICPNHQVSDEGLVVTERASLVAFPPITFSSSF